MTKIGDNPRRLPKRFYAQATLVEDEGRFAVALDGRLARTRLGGRLGARSEALGAAIVAEWNAQQDVIDFASMPLTRLQMTATDLGPDERGAWTDIVVAYLQSDLLCHRAEGPSALRAAQAAAWDPLLEKARALSGGAIAPVVGVGIAPVRQPPAVADAARLLLRAASDEELISIRTITEIAGSAIIGIVAWRGGADSGALFDASRVDETFQESRWGADAEASRRTALLREEFLAAARFLSHC